MANFKGGFAFNNEAAKVEVEQSPNGALISCINPVTGESMGGGNPNSVQVIEGSLINPFHSWTTPMIEELHTACWFGNANIVIDIDATALGYTDHIVKGMECFYTDTFTVEIIGTDEENTISGFHADWVWNWEGGQPVDYEAGEIYLVNEGSVVDIKSTASLIPTTLTIYWHPMPEEGE